MPSFLDALRWRYATKKFDPNKKLTDTQLQDLLDAMQLSASSFGLQPYRVLVITNPELRAKMRSHAWDQAQLTDCSHLIAFCSLKSIDEQYVDQYVEHLAKARSTTPGAIKQYRDMMVGSVKGNTPEGLAAWLKCQAYIAVGFLLSAAAQMQIDACPMEGFDPVHVDVDLGLTDTTMTTAVLVALGFRDPSDPHLAFPKVRLPKEQLFVWKK